MLPFASGVRSPEELYDERLTDAVSRIRRGRASVKKLKQICDSPDFGLVDGPVRATGLLFQLRHCVLVTGIRAQLLSGPLHGRCVGAGDRRLERQTTLLAREGTRMHHLHAKGLTSRVKDIL